MKQFINYSIILFVSVALGFSSCKEKEEEKPSTTTTTKTGIFSCKVDGKDWESNERSVMSQFMDTTLNSVSAEAEADTLAMMGIRTNGTDTSILLFNVLLQTPRTTTYNMTGVDYNIFYIKGNSLTAFLSTLFGYTATSSLTITKYDAANHKISGTFNTTMVSTGTAPTITVSNGTFTDVYLNQK